MKTGQFIVLTRDQEGNKLWASTLADQGYIPYELPCIQMIPMETTPHLRTLIERISAYDWLILTSSTGVKQLKNLLDELKIDISIMNEIKIAVVGNQTATHVRALGLAVSFVPSQADSMTLARELPDVANQKVLWLHADIAPKEPIQNLLARSAKLTGVAVYKTKLITAPDLGFNQLLNTGGIGAIVFASPSALAGFKLRLQQDKSIGHAQSLPVIAIGPHIASQLSTAGFNHIRTAAKPDIIGLIDQLNY